MSNPVWTRWEYNRQIYKIFIDTSNSHEASCKEPVPRAKEMETLREAMETAADIHFQLIDPKKKQSYISQSTWTLIEFRQKGWE